MSPRFVLERENVPCVAEVVNRSLKTDCTDFKIGLSACIQLPIMKHPSRKVQDLRHLLSRDPIEDKVRICLLCDSRKNKLEYSFGSDSYTVVP